ncbi:Hypothetical protein CAP_8693 [Chondromyces apiculatus DSM 436]|uniref:Uncharacterized protein n=1 Tax=Chondromyces apiculatus DSM 436 TaxID=1192034 RepID=A0A017TFJ2_9BACT|nr:Hypothetical protein CAP_8693 [Chondromyces apiculatus DSM 436]
MAAAIALAAACDDGAPPPAPPTPATPVSAAAPEPPAGAAPADSAPAPAAGSPSNPLGLPVRRMRLDPGRRVFTFSDRMLAAAKPGSTLVFYAATVVGFDGDELIVEGRGGASYKVHPGYVIAVPDKPRLALQAPVLTEWNGVMKHGILRRFVKDRVGVEFTDADGRAPEAMLKDARFVPQQEGLVPGNYAALREGDGWRQVLLVSKLGEETPARWFVLGYGGAARIVEEAALKPIPIQFKNQKVGTQVWAAWVGELRPATLQSADDVGFYTVKFERAGRPVRVGWGHLVLKLEGG